MVYVKIIDVTHFMHFLRLFWFYKDKGELKVNLLIREFWTQGIDSIHDMRVMNTDAPYHQSKTPKKCLKTSDKEKTNKYLNFVASVDSLLRVE